jgi:hypothetical protein
MPDQTAWNDYRPAATVAPVDASYLGARSFYDQ